MFRNIYHYCFYIYALFIYFQMQNDGPIYVSSNTDSLGIQAPEKISELSAYCLNHGIERNATTTTKECNCLPGYSGEHCETYVCHNYCVHGSCSVDSLGNSKCECEHGWTGDRCGMDTCDNYCLNNGHCYKLLSDPLSTPKCKCSPDYEGDRCEQPVSGNIQEFCDRYCKYFAVNSETVVLQTPQFCRCVSVNYLFSYKKLKLCIENLGVSSVFNSLGEHWVHQTLLGIWYNLLYKLCNSLYN